MNHPDDSDDSDDEDEDDGRPDGWEDELADQQDAAERANQNEEKLAVEEADEAALSKIQRRAAMMNFMSRRMRATSTAVRTKEQIRAPVHSYSCPICLSCPKAVRATRCGHLFCAPCIERAVETNGICPTCRKAAVMAQIRTVDLRVY